MLCFALIVKPSATARMMYAPFAGAAPCSTFSGWWGGALQSQKTQSAGDGAKTAKYNLELIAKVREVPATEVSLIIESMTRLAAAGGAVESLRINIETVFKTEGVFRAA
jgi:hypothetical protein